MLQFESGLVSGDDVVMLSGRIEERLRRIRVLLQIDERLAQAASSHHLAADLVRRHWGQPMPRNVMRIAD